MPIVLGLVVFLTSCAVFGRIAAHFERFDHFSRFFVYIQPQTQYYPTISELVGTTLALAPRDKILVVIGGNSIFRGTGQNPDGLWSKALQADLGEEYTVVNLSIDQAGMESFAGLAFRVLQVYYPRSIYVGTLDTRGFDALDGLPIYRYLFWDAYYKGFFKTTPAERLSISALRWRQLRTLDGLQLHSFAILDSIFYFSALKNLISYRVISPDWTVEIPWPFKRRDWYKEGNDPNLPLIQQRQANDKALADLMTARFTAAVTGSVTFSMGQAQLNPAVGDRVLASFDSFFPSELRQKIIGVVIAPNPLFVAKLPPEIREGLAVIETRTIELFRKQGYRGFVAGMDYTPADYVDQGHLMASGGLKLADQVAVQVRVVSRQQGFR